jgi:hypothetical protein
VLILTCTYLQFCRDNDAEPGPDQKKPRWDILGRKFVGAKGGAGGKKDISKTEITALKYSPSGDVLAVATRDKIIHLLSAAVSNVISVSASFMILISLIFVIMFSRTRTVISAQLLARGIAVPLSALISRTMECCCRHLTVCGKLYSGKLQQESL